MRIWRSDPREGRGGLFTPRYSCREEEDQMAWGPTSSGSSGSWCAGWVAQGSDCVCLHEIHGRTMEIRCAVDSGEKMTSDSTDPCVRERDNGTRSGRLTTRTHQRVTAWDGARRPHTSVGAVSRIGLRRRRSQDGLNRWSRLKQRFHFFLFFLFSFSNLFYSNFEFKFKCELALKLKLQNKNTSILFNHFVLSCIMFIFLSFISHLFPFWLSKFKFQILI
jgi:hypothetical protein